MGTETQEAKLLDALAKLGALLMAVHKKHPDFAFLLERDVLFQQAQCWLSLARLRRLSVANSMATQVLSLDDTALTSIAEPLAHARRIYFTNDASKSKSYAQGQVHVLVEEAELLVMRGQSTEALAVYDRAIQLCTAQGDHTQQTLVSNKLESLRLDVDAWGKLDELPHNTHDATGEQAILRQCFDQLTRENDDGSLHKAQLTRLARDLGASVTLSANEIDEWWTQIRAHDPRPVSHFDGVDFHGLWRWWMAEEMYTFRCQRSRRHAK